MGLRIQMSMRVREGREGPEGSDAKDTGRDAEGRCSRSR